MTALLEAMLYRLYMLGITNHAYHLKFRRCIHRPPTHKNLWDCYIDRHGLMP